jgi:hypothetical protein
MRTPSGGISMEGKEYLQLRNKTQVNAEKDFT